MDRYWVMACYKGKFGKDTVGIVDEEEGGIILYCHEFNAQRILDALLATAS